MLLFSPVQYVQNLPFKLSNSACDVPVFVRERREGGFGATHALIPSALKTSALVICINAVYITRIRGN